MQWYTINNTEKVDTPALVLYKERVQQNILKAVDRIGDVNRLRPHVKTNKMAEVCSMMMDAGIRKFKCATIAEAEMLGMINAEDVLLAYQPVGPKAERLLHLVQNFPKTQFSCLVDNRGTAKDLSDVFLKTGLTIRVYIDVNTGMNRTGIKPEGVNNLLDILEALPGLKVEGLHAYDGHLTESNVEIRQEQSDKAFASIQSNIDYFQSSTSRTPAIVAGGSPTFPTHIGRNADCSPGTFVFWDWGYTHKFPEEPFESAALVLTRVISVLNDTLITTDLGHKAVSAENPLSARVHFLNAPMAKPVSQSEEHLSLEVPDSSLFKVGDLLYGMPVHICPTVALYNEALVSENNLINDSWKVIARDRQINY